MRTLYDQLSSYAAYHRDRRNIATHFVGIPMIVVAVFTFLARPTLVVAGVPLTPALALFAGSVMFYLLLDVWFGLAMAAVTAPAMYLGLRIGSESTAVWLAAGAGLFLAGWVIQFVGHAFEGKKPAFVDDIVGLMIGPLFLVAETVFALGLRRPLHESIEAKVGPTLARRTRRSSEPLPQRG